MKTVCYKAYFIFNKKVPKIVEKIISIEFLRLRHYAAEALNPHYKEWNSEFTGPEPSEDDSLAEYGGTAYCEFIREKERTVLRKVNMAHPSKIIELDTDEIGDIIAKTKIGNMTMSMELEPISS